jgi:hypothetical protein
MGNVLLWVGGVAIFGIGLYAVFHGGLGSTSAVAVPTVVPLASNSGNALAAAGIGAAAAIGVAALNNIDF